MKKLELNQMINVNGGDFCSRMKARYERLQGREKNARRARRMHKTYQKAVDGECEY